MTDNYRKGIDERELDTILADDFEFEGEMSFSKPLRLNGRVKGDIRATSDFIIGEGAVVEAHVEARIVDVRGSITGNIAASARIELSSTAQVRGDLTAPELVVDPGARFNGLCRMPEGKSE